jgi:hypothetical protein
VPASAQFEELRDGVYDRGLCPPWLVGAARDAWNLDLSTAPLSDAVLVREPSPLGFGRASYELNLGCNYDCEHCYLGLKQFSGLEWDARVRLLRMLRDAGVLWLQLTGGEPLIDKLFVETYALAYELGMLLHISSNASRLHNPQILDLLACWPAGLLACCKPYRITVSVYGATEASYDGLFRRRGAFKLFERACTRRSRPACPCG